MTDDPLARLRDVRAVRRDRAAAEFGRCRRLAAEALARRDLARRQLDAHRVAAAARTARAYAQLVGRASAPHAIEAARRRVDDFAAEGRRLAEALDQAEAALRRALEALEAARRAVLAMRRSLDKLEVMAQRTGEARSRDRDRQSERADEDQLFDRRIAPPAPGGGW